MHSFGPIAIRCHLPEAQISTSDFPSCQQVPSNAGAHGFEVQDEIWVKTADSTIKVCLSRHDLVRAILCRAEPPGGQSMILISAVLAHDQCHLYKVYSA